MILLAFLTLTARGQVKFPEYIEHNDPTLALVDQEQIRGHHWSVIDKTARNAIPGDKREIGMLVTWIESAKYTTQRFQGANVTDLQWTNDVNWTRFVINSDTIVYADTAFYALQALNADTSDYVRNLISVDSINFNEVALDNYTQGNLRYDSASQSLQFLNDISDFRHNLGYEFVVRVWNESGGLIPNGTVVNLDTIHMNGQPIPTIRRAGNLGIDSLIPIGVTTVDIPNNSHGIVTLFGEVKGLNTTAFNTRDVLYVGNNGQFTNVSPEPPAFNLAIGFVFYADNDSGSIYIQPQPPTYLPSPHVAADTSRYNTVLPIITQNVFEYLPISDTQLDDNHGFIIAGDSVQVLQRGAYTIALNLSYIGNAQSDVWRKGVFLNGVEKNTVSRSTTSTSVGNSTVIASFFVEAGDWISFRMTNESADRDPTISDLSWEIIFLHR